MKFNRKAVISIAVIVVLITSGLVAFSQFFLGGSPGGQPNEIVVLETSMGKIEIQLDSQHAPITVNNFVTYVKAGFYNDTLIHRVESGFVIQGGGFSVNGTEKTTNAPIKLESNNGLKNIAGTVAMARTNTADSATSQFFINLVDNPNLDYSSTNPGYAVFGKVISGIDVINQIAKVPTYTRNVTIPGYGPYPFEKWPVNDIVITRAYIKP
jgi:peptidyl-prolyl cis-trans isomerase A (cyclophilin A)